MLNEKKCRETIGCGNVRSSNEVCVFSYILPSFWSLICPLVNEISDYESDPALQHTFQTQLDVATVLPPASSKKPTLSLISFDLKVLPLSSPYWNDEYNGEYFQQHQERTAVNTLSPFIANIFMSKFETEVKDKFEYFPRVWFRYVDDIFAVFDTKAISLDNFVAKLNNRFPTIKFTYEVEHNEQLPFLDVLVIRNSENKLEFDVYRKETATLRYIPNDSHHPFQHKMASFNFQIHRFKERFEHETQLIKNIAKSNGYSVHLIDKLIRKHKFKRTLYNSTTFRRDTDNSKFASLPIMNEPKFTRGLDKIFKNININLVYNSKNKLQTLLGNPKDKINNNEKSGIYEISCKDCDQKYIGQTKRSILTRFKEHMAHLKYGRTEKSCVAQHAFDNNHRIDINNLKLIRNVTNSRQLDAFESLEIIKCNNSMNKDNGPIPTSPLFALINKDGYGSVNRGNKFGINSASV
ncbi:hypothetical protein NQ318_023287 [Aromia moschata]|uniref:GIY-YIG domain-containing protein n=1 Tax=Aromia moschata TaxID=1265417 RepID=A0AAV8Y6H6_9CUCU|nr:hypothetical protein NQ318_023287 [Aromia moschata]